MTSIYRGVIFIKLNKQNMIKKLGMKEEEIELVLSYMEVLPVNEEERKGFCTSGRKLHEVLGIGTQFSIWIKRMIDYGFEEELDYILVTQKRLTNNPKNPYTEETDYILTLDMAKQLGMMQRNEMGMAIRKYYIAIEKAFEKAQEWEVTRKESKKLQKEMMAIYTKEYIQKNARKPRNYGTVQDTVYYVCFDMSAKELKSKLELKYYQSVPEWVEEKIEQVLCYTYDKMITLIEMGMLDIKEIESTLIKLFDKKYGGIIEI